MARFSEQSKLPQLLSEGATIKSACHKLSLNRTTYYKWYKNNLDFRKKVDEAIKLGKYCIRDLAFSNLTKAVIDGNLKAAIFTLQHYDPDFRPVRTAYVNPIDHRHELAPGEICGACGFREPPVEEYKAGDSKTMDSDMLSRELYKRVRSLNTRKVSNAEIREIVNDFIEEKNVKISIEVIDRKIDIDDDSLQQKFSETKDLEPS